MITAERQSLLSTALSSVRSENAFTLALERLTTAFGYSHYFLLRAPAMDDATLTDLMVATSMPPAFIEDFDAADMLAVSPVLQRIRESVMPQTWHARKQYTFADITMPESLANLLEAYHVPAGISCPVHCGDGQRLILTLAGIRGNLAQSEINELYMLVLQATDAYNYLKTVAKTLPHPLSAREIEVVRWTAQGKTSIEIGQILSLSDHTINAYMNNAMKKLNCVNRTQLVAKSIRLKLIS